MAGLATGLLIIIAWLETLAMVSGQGTTVYGNFILSVLYCSRVFTGFHYLYINTNNSTLSSLNPVHLTLGTGDPITTNITDILITTIGEDTGLPPLTCHTDLVKCCRISDQDSGTEGLGMWINPNGDVLGNNAGGGAFFIRRNDAQLIRLNRRMTVAATSPTGLYCCVVPIDGGGEQTFCANLGTS